MVKDQLSTKGKGGVDAATRATKTRSERAVAREGEKSPPTLQLQLDHVSIKQPLRGEPGGFACHRRGHPSKAGLDAGPDRLGLAALSPTCNAMRHRPQHLGPEGQGRAFDGLGGSVRRRHALPAN